MKDLAAAAAAAAKSAKASSTSAKAASAKTKAPPDAATPPAGKSRAGSAQPGMGQAGMAQASGKSKSSSHKTSDNSDGQSAGDNSTSDAAAASNGNSAATGASKGRAPGRGSAAKGSGSQNADTQAASSTAKDPGSDTSNASGLSLLQLLAQSLEGDNSAAPSADSTTTATEDKATNDNGANADANAIALAQFTRALAAALGGATAALQTGASNASVADGSGVSVTDVTKGASARDLVALLAQNIAADSQGKSDTVASQSDVAATKDSPTGTAGPNSLAQMGVTSHFSLQQPQNASNTGELKSPVGSAAWNDELGAQLTWMTRKGLESGSLRVSPEHLGPVEVQITVQNGDASVWFGASHPETRAALEQALPRLREMFASQGMTLTDSGVSRESPRNQTKSDSPQSVASVSAVGSADVSVASAMRVSLGLVDTYA